MASILKASETMSSFNGWEPDDNDSHECKTADGVEIHIGMWVIDYDRRLSQVTGVPEQYQLKDTVCWSCAGHHGHWWDTTTGTFDGSRLTTRGVAEARRTADAVRSNRYAGMSDSEYRAQLRVDVDKMMEKRQLEREFNRSHFTVRVSADAMAKAGRVHYFIVPLDKQQELLDWLADNKAERE